MLDELQSGNNVSTSFPPSDDFVRYRTELDDAFLHHVFVSLRTYALIQGQDRN